MDFIKLLTGADAPAAFLGLIFFAMIGQFLSLLMQTTKRDVNSQHTPFRFSWNFLWCDNSKRVLATLILIYIFLRFTPQLLGFQITDFFALAIGFCSDKLAQLLKDKTSFLGGSSK